MDANRSRTVMGLSVGDLSLLLLTFQNSIWILLMHYSRIMPAVSGHRYFTSTAVFLNEVFKLAISLSLSLYEVSHGMSSSTPVTSLFTELFRLVFTGDSWSMAVPAVLYTLQNSLQYVAVSNLDAATFQVTYQLKILATAIFSVTLLGRRLSLSRWMSLVMLTLGVGIVQLPSEEELPTLEDLKGDSTGWGIPRTMEQMRDMGNKAAGQLLAKRSATYEGIEEDFRVGHPTPNPTIGFVAVVVACIISGLAGVYFEKVLKESNTRASVWVRNVQLSFYSLFPALFIGVMFKDGADIAKHGFFSGYNWVVWAAITSQAAGGIMVSLVVNYADNIAKNFATSISIILSFIVGIFFFNTAITFKFILGTSIVLLATYIYTAPETTAGTEETSTAMQEKSAAQRSEKSFFDVAPPSKPKLDVPRTGQARTTSRPGTPTFERRHVSSNSADIRSSKRDE